MLELLKAKGKYCTGCGACYNICPKDAIHMEPDSEGFLVPQVDEEQCIHCGLCEKTCPVLNPVYKNDSNPDCYALRASDEVRAKCSSGGTFTLIAEQTLMQGGVVFGAAWNSDWTVSHIAVEDKEHLEALKGSKYLQSATNDAFAQVKKYLQQGRAVLYSGCPCQIAGLYAYLGDKVPQDKLFTAELICHGTPSPKAFQKYLSDNYDVSAIERIDFRDKSVFKWSSTCNIYFKDGTQVHKRENDDAWYRAFLPCMSMRPSCSHCEFARLPRQADMSMGDYWKIERFDPSWTDGKGTSLLLVNTPKGHKMLEAISRRCEYVKTPIEYATFWNPTIIRSFRAHTSRKHFYSMLDYKPFNKLVEDALNHHYDIGIVGVPYGINYGSVLTYYALYRLLQQKGHDVVLMPKPNRLWTSRFDQPDTIAHRFIQPRCNIFPVPKTQEQFVEMNDRCTDFLVGSDCMWNWHVCGRDTDTFFFLDWVECGHRKIAYATSFAADKLVGPEPFVQRCVYYLQKFDAISMRENSGVKALQEKYGRPDAVQVLDPVFMCGREIYDEAAATVDCPAGVFAYVLNACSTPQQVLSVLDYVGQMQQMPVHLCGNPNNMEAARKRYGERLLSLLSVEEWLGYIKNSSFVIGDSFHAMCFALIYHKPFAIIYEYTGAGSAIARFQDLLKALGLEDRLLTSWDDMEGVNRLVNTPIEWREVDRRMAGWRKFSEQWLEDALHKELRQYTPEEYVVDRQRRLRSQEALERYEIRQKLEELSIRQETTEALRAIENSRSFRIGRAITWLPRKIRGGFRCVKENGWKYTIRHFGEKVKGKFHH